ncbi:MAG TPA: hypothetical protein PKK61_01375 [Defluviitaleaceae bacterium]|jgi:hypothetical protein|nr:nuclear transport factor 2 family protein [Candidatus Epulonipiscium sp.]HOA79703.1 hypothetical protein [Defluviitaleaceae bacterium]
MKNKIIAILLISIFALSLVGCSKNGPEQAVIELFDAMKNTDLEKLSEILDSDSSEIAEQDTFLKLIKKSNETLTYKIGEVTIDGDTAVVKVSCTYGDVNKIFELAMSNYFVKAMEASFSGEEVSDEYFEKILDEEIIAALETTTTEEYSTELTVDCIKKDGKWAIDTNKDNKELANVFTGNLLKSIESMVSSMESSFDE